MIEFDSGSFKDPGGQVFTWEGRIYRRLSAEGHELFGQLQRSGLYDALASAGSIVQTSLTSSHELGLDPNYVGAKVLQHERIPFITYPYEWSFDMMRDAALLTLDALEQSLKHGFILKDATPFNVQFLNAKPVLIDVLSFQPHAFNQPWAAYSQFCSTQLYPLLLTAYKNIEFQPWLRGSISGIKAKDMAKLLRGRDLFRRGVLMHVALPAKLEKSLGGQLEDLRKYYSETRFSDQILFRLCEKLRKLLACLRYQPKDSEWADYIEDRSYKSSDIGVKESFVHSTLQQIKPGKIWDLGCNTGEFSKIASQFAELVVSFDIDPAAINLLYLAQKDGRMPNHVQGVVGDLTNPSPSLGWDLKERRSWQDRGHADAFIALALVHHLVISGNIPLKFVVDLLARVAPAGVVEFVSKDDDMVQRMLANRDDVFEDYAKDAFESYLASNFEIVRQRTVKNGARVLYHVEPIYRHNKS